MMGQGYGMMDGGFGWIGWIFQVLVLVAVIYLVAYGIRTFSANGGRDRRSTPTDDAHQILAERFARGEISAEEYRAMKDQLK